MTKTKYKGEYDFYDQGLKYFKSWEPRHVFSSDKDKNGNYCDCFDYFILEKHIYYDKAYYDIYHSTCSNGAFYRIFKTDGNINSPIIKGQYLYTGEQDKTRMNIKLKYYNGEKEKQEIEYNKKYK